MANETKSPTDSFAVLVSTDICNNRASVQAISVGSCIEDARTAAEQYAKREWVLWVRIIDAHTGLEVK